MAAAALRIDTSSFLPRDSGWLMAQAAAWLATGADGWLGPSGPRAAACGRRRRWLGRKIAVCTGCDMALVIRLGVLSIATLAPPASGRPPCLGRTSGSLDVVLRRYKTACYSRHVRPYPTHQRAEADERPSPKPIARSVETKAPADPSARVCEPSWRSRRDRYGCARSSPDLCLRSDRIGTFAIARCLLEWLDHRGYLPGASSNKSASAL